MKRVRIRDLNLNPNVKTKFDILPQPLIVNLYGEPCAGKSTVAAETFAALKRRGCEVELVTEFAKDLTWEKRDISLACQEYVFGKQYRNIRRLFGQVDVIVTDSPLFLSLFYAEWYSPHNYSTAFKHSVIHTAKSLGGLNYFLRRTGPYNPNGRNQSEAEALEIGTALHDSLLHFGIPFVNRQGCELLHKSIATDVMMRVRLQQLGYDYVPPSFVDAEFKCRGWRPTEYETYRAHQTVRALAAQSALAS